MAHRRDAVDDPRNTARIAVVDDVRGLQEGGLAQPADRTPRRVRAQHRRSEAVLMQPHDRLARRVAPHIFSRYEARRSRVRDRQPGLELDELGSLVNGDDERRRHDRVLARSDAAEVDQRHGQLLSCDQRPIVGGSLEARRRRLCLSGAEAIGDAVGGFVELVVVWRRPAALGRGGDKAQRGGANELLGPEDAAVERAEAHTAAAKLEAFAEGSDRNEIVIAALELADALERGVAQLDVAQIGHVA